MEEVTENIPETVDTGGSLGDRIIVKHSDGAYFWRGHCPRLKLCHLIISTHSTDQWPVTHTHTHKHTHTYIHT